jgi:hypothetical protein
VHGFLDSPKGVHSTVMLVHVHKELQTFQAKSCEVSKRFGR